MAEEKKTGCMGRMFRFLVKRNVYKKDNMSDLVAYKIKERVPNKSRIISGIGQTALVVKNGCIVNKCESGKDVILNNESKLFAPITKMLYDKWQLDEWEVYFFKTSEIRIKWGTSQPIQYKEFHPTLTGPSGQEAYNFLVRRIGMSGELFLQLKNPEAFLSKFGNDFKDYTSKDLKDYIDSCIRQQIMETVAQQMEETSRFNNCPVIETALNQISDGVKKRLGDDLGSLGFEVSRLYNPDFKYEDQDKLRKIDNLREDAVISGMQNAIKHQISISHSLNESDRISILGKAINQALGITGNDILDYRVEISKTVMDSFDHFLGEYRKLMEANNPIPANFPFNVPLAPMATGYYPAAGVASVPPQAAPAQPAPDSPDAD